jgi:phospholipid/cholesterol/gamma-HCH transport system substrate-binding protein
MSATKLFDAKTFQDFWKLVVFIIVTTLATALLAITIGNVTFGRTDEYKAVFTDVTGVNKGDDVRIAGVKVGSVKGIEISDDARTAVVTFTVDSAQQIATTTEATIKYRNLIGQRYLALTNQLVGDASAMQEGQTIPVGQTHPALDLTVLFNGFKPLFQALSPNDVNTLSYEIVQVFQGEGGTLESLLSHTASLTSTLAEKDQIINALIDNLTEVLEHVGDREKELSRLIVTFRDFVGGLNNDREAILGSLDQISALSVETADLVHEVKDPLWTTCARPGGSPTRSPRTRSSSTTPSSSSRSSWTRSVRRRPTAAGSTSTSAVCAARSETLRARTSSSTSTSPVKRGATSDDSLP